MAEHIIFLLRKASLYGRVDVIILHSKMTKAVPKMVTIPKTLIFHWLGRKNGAPTRTRTADLLITNQLLYQLSYRGTVVIEITWASFYLCCRILQGLFTREMRI